MLFYIYVISASSSAQSGGTSGDNSNVNHSQPSLGNKANASLGIPSECLIYSQFYYFISRWIVIFSTTISNGPFIINKPGVGGSVWEILILTNCFHSNGLPPVCITYTLQKLEMKTNLASPSPQKLVITVLPPLKIVEKINVSPHPR